MKKLYRSLLAVAALAMVSCSQFEEQVPAPEVGADDPVFTATIDAETRTHMGPAGEIFWCATDEVSVFGKTGYHTRYAVKEGAETVEAQFAAVSASFDPNSTGRYHVRLNGRPDANYAIYPFSEENAIDVETGELTLDLTCLAEQNYVGATYEDNKAAMVARSNERDLNFYNTLSMVRFRVCTEFAGEYTIEKIIVKVGDNELLNGLANVAFAEDMNAVFTSGTNTTTMTIDGGVVLENDHPVDHNFYVLIPAATFETFGYELVVRDNMTDELLSVKKQAPYAMTFRRNEITTIHTSIEPGTLTGYTESWEGKPWDGKTLTAPTNLEDAGLGIKILRVKTAPELAYLLSNEVNVKKYITELNGGEAPMMATLWIDGDLDMGGHIIPGFINGTGAIVTGLNSKTGENSVIRDLCLTNVAGQNDAGFLGSADAYCGGDIQNLTFEECSVVNADNGNGYAGMVCGLAGYATLHVSNVEVKNCYVEGVQSVGGLVGFYTTGGDYNHTIKNCVVDGVTVKNRLVADESGRLGGLVGRVADNLLVENTVVKNSTIEAYTVDQSHSKSIGYFVGNFHGVDPNKLEIVGGQQFNNKIVAKNDNALYNQNFYGPFLGGWRNDGGTVIINGVEVLKTDAVQVIGITPAMVEEFESEPNRAFIADVDYIITGMGFGEAYQGGTYLEQPAGGYTLNGNGQTLTYEATEGDAMAINTFYAFNSDKVTINDLTLEGEIQATTLGVYARGNVAQQSQFNTELNRVNIVNTKAASFSSGMGAAVFVYGTAVLNDCNVYGTTRTELETSPLWPIYDLIVMNYTNTTLNGGKYGKIGNLTNWPQCQMTVNGAEVDVIYSCFSRRATHPEYGLYVKAGSKVGTLYGSCYVVGGTSSTFDAHIEIEAGATVDVLDLNGVAVDGNLEYIVIEEGANVGKVIYNDIEMTVAEFLAMKEVLARGPLAKDNAELATAISEGNDTIVLPAGTFIIPDEAQGKTLTFVGIGDPEDTKIATQDDGSYEGCDYSLDGATVVFENVSINTDSSTYTGYARLNATYKNCIINGTYTLYGDSVFEDCVFNVSGDVYNIWTWGAPTATFTRCTFNSDGKAMLLYGTENTKLTINDSTFNDKGGLADKKAAIEIGDDYGKSYELFVNKTVVNGYEINDKGINTGTTLWGNKNSMSQEKLNVVVDGVDVY